MAPQTRIPFLRHRVPVWGILLLLVQLVGSSLPAQNAALRRGHRYYDAMVYPKAVLAFERGLKRRPDPLAYERLGDAYRQLGNTAAAEPCYAAAVKGPDASTSAKLHYAEMLKANGKYQEAAQWYRAYLLTGAQPERAARALEGCDFAAAVLADSNHYTIAREAFNTRGSEIGPLIYQQGLLIAHEKKGGLRRVFNLRNYNHFYDLAYIQKGVSGKGYKVHKLKGKVNSRYHEGPAALSANQDQLLFTRSYVVASGRGMGAPARSRLKLLQASFARGKWQNITTLPFNSDAYSCGHPALSPEADLLIFASDMPGGFGGTDLYLSRREGLGWTNPRNLGPAINTEGNERFPFLLEDGTLFFASDGLPGLGGLDLFAAPAKADGWESPFNLGYPLNSAQDDFSITWARNRANGYFASNRSGDDDIYSFRRLTTLNGTVVDARTGLPIPDARIRIREAGGKEAQYSTSADGKFSHFSTWGQDLLLDISAPGFLPASQHVPTKDIAPYADKAVTLRLEPDLVFSLAGKITDAKTREPLTDAYLRIITDKGEQRLRVDGKGDYSQRLAEATDYTVVAMAPGHVPQFFQVSTVGKNVTQDWVFNATLEPGNFMLVEGKTLSSQDSHAIGGIEIAAMQTRPRQELARTVSRADGRYWHVLKAGGSPYLLTTHPGYFVTKTALPALAPGRDTTLVRDIAIVPYQVGAIVKVIYYEYNKSDVHEQAGNELDDIVYFLRANPEASVELSSYTDSRGGTSYNERLSQARADAAVSYIVSKGVAQSRIKAKGYGESSLINACDDNQDCTEEQHAQNRRTEIKVTRIKGN